MNTFHLSFFLDTPHWAMQYSQSSENNYPKTLLHSPQIEDSNPEDNTSNLEFEETHTGPHKDYVGSKNGRYLGA